MNIVNERPVMVFRFQDGDKIRYTVGLSKKNKDESYDNAFFPIEFNQGVELENKTKIVLKTAWLSFYNYEFEGKKGSKFFIKCSEFDELETPSYEEESAPADAQW